MLDAFREETIVRKVGGRFKLSALIQKRMVALNRGARPLVDIVANNPMMIVVEEILNDKIYLDNTGNVAIAGAGDTVGSQWRSGCLQGRCSRQWSRAGRSRGLGDHDLLGHAIHRCHHIRSPPRPTGAVGSVFSPGALSGRAPRVGMSGRVGERIAGLGPDPGSAGSRPGR